MKYLFFYIIVFLLLASCNRGQGQMENEPTEFEKLFKKAKELRYKDPKRALELFQLCDSFAGVKNRKVNVKTEMAWTYFLLNDFGSSLSFFHQALQEPNTAKNFGRIYRGMGAIHAKERNLDSAEVFIEKAIKYYEDSNCTQGLMETKTVMGNVLKHRGLVDEALANYHEAIDFHLQKNNHRWLTIMYIRTGILYTEMKDYKEARAYLFKARDLAKKKGVDYLFDNIHGAIADSYRRESLLDSALVYYGAILSRDSVQRPPDGMVLNYPRIGDIYKEQGKYGLAKEMYQKSLEICRQNGNGYGVLVNKLSLASLLREQGDFDGAISSIKRITSEIDPKDKKTRKEIYFDFYQTYKLKGDMEQALSYYELYSSLNDSLVGENARSNSLYLEKRHQTKLKNEQIKSLQEIVEKNMVIGYGKIGIFALIVGLLIFMVLWLRARKNLIKRLHESEKQENLVLKTELENKTKELTSNILRLAASQDVAQKVKRKINELFQKNTKLAKSDFSQITNYLNNQNNDKRWKEYHKQFDELHVGFLDKLTLLYPDLTAAEIRLCTLLRLNMTTKDICFITNRSLRTVENTRYRLRKKMKLDRGSTLSQHILSI